jgi:hypothetical protein
VTGGLVDQWDPGWVATSGPGQDGRAELWFAVFTADWTFMGAAPAPGPVLVWKDGHLCLSYSPLVVVIRVPGWYKTGVICAVMPGARQYRPLWPVSLGEPRELRAGDTITVTEGLIKIHPDLIAEP